MAGSLPRVFVMDKKTAVELARILRDLTPQRIGNMDDYAFCAWIVDRIDTKFGVTRNAI